MLQAAKWGTLHRTMVFKVKKHPNLTLEMASLWIFDVCVAIEGSHF